MLFFSIRQLAVKTIKTKTARLSELLISVFGLSLNDLREYKTHLFHLFLSVDISLSRLSLANFSPACPPNAAPVHPSISLDSLSGFGAVIKKIKKINQFQFSQCRKMMWKLFIILSQRFYDQVRFH